MNGGRLCTLGHSSRELGEFLGILRAHGMAHVADVRAWPRSRRHPQFDGAALAAALAAAGFGYSHHPGLGGKREPRADSPHSALGDDAFRGYADHMGSPEFEAALAGLLALAGGRATAVMCAEARPEQCHRAFLSDLLVTRGWRVDHLLSAGESVAHVRHPLARLEGGRLVYRGPQESLGL